MSAELAWGAPYFTGGPPATTPFTPGTSGLITDRGFDGFTSGNLAFGVTGGIANITIYFTPLGGSIGVVDAYSVGPADFNNVDMAYYRPGKLEIVGESAGVLLTNKLVAVVANLDGGDYGSLAWYEEEATIPPSFFWRSFVNSEELQ